MVRTESSKSGVLPPHTLDRCFRLILEFPPINRSLLEAELDVLWQRYGIEYQIVGTSENPAEMPLLMEPVADHRFTRRFPPSFESDVETEESRRASDDVTSLSLFEDSTASTSVSHAGAQEFALPISGQGLSSSTSSVVVPEAPDYGSVASSSATTDTIFECFSSGARPI